MIASVFIRRLKEGATFEDFVREWEAEKGFGVPTRVINSQSLQDPRDIISIGFVDASPEQLAEWFAISPQSEEARHARIDSVIEATTLKCQYEVKTEYDLTDTPRPIPFDSPESLFTAMRGSQPSQ